MKQLNLLPPTKEPKATEYIPEMIKIIEQLINNQYAYVGENGDVYYNVRCFKTYGHLSHKELMIWKAVRVLRFLMLNEIR